MESIVKKGENAAYQHLNMSNIFKSFPSQARLKLHV